MSRNKINFILLIVLGIVVLLSLMSARIVQAQNWSIMPPYNTLWPLWSPALSPLDAAGIPTPIVNTLNPWTFLPIQPALTWNPALAYPWLLYNAPTGLGYFDQIFGFNMWPPFNVNFPLALNPGAINLPPTPLSWGELYLPIANLTYSNLYAIDPTVFAALLTPAAIWGLL